MYKNFKITAIILMGGKGERFESLLPKQFHLLSGKELYLHTLENFQNMKIFDEIIIAANKDHIKKIRKDIKNLKIKVIEGGETRQLSSYKALLSCKYREIVVIHDAVRPFISSEIILKNIKKAIKYGACNTCIKTFDTIVQSKNNLKIDKIPKRETLLRGQTPQTFKYEIILKAHKKAILKNLKNASDDCSLVIDSGQKVYIEKGDEFNIKVTTPLDLFIAEKIFSLRRKKVISQKKSLKGKTYIVVGSSGGIGKKICLLLKKEKAKIIPLSRSSNIKIDLSSKKNIREVFKKIYKKYKKVDGLINSAGFLKVSPLKKLSFKDIENQININLLGLILCCREVKIKKRGHIINISSSSYLKGRKFSSIYSSSKAAVVNFTQALSEELFPTKVNSIAPPRTNTKLRRKNFPFENKKLLLSPLKVAEEVINILKSDITGSIVIPSKN